MSKQTNKPSEGSGINVNTERNTQLQTEGGRMRDKIH